MAKAKYIETPEELLRLWDEYKAQIDDNPDAQEVATGKGVHTIRVKRPYQRKGFERFVYRKLGFHVHQYIDNYNNAYDAYLGVVTCMRNEWEEDQIEGTLTGRYKAPNLVARLNGLVDKAETKNESVITGKVVVVKQNASGVPLSNRETDVDTGS